MTLPQWELVVWWIWEKKRGDSTQLWIPFYMHNNLNASWFKMAKNFNMCYLEFSKIWRIINANYYKFWWFLILIISCQNNQVSINVDRLIHEPQLFFKQYHVKKKSKVQPFVKEKFHWINCPPNTLWNFVFMLLE